MCLRFRIAAYHERCYTARSICLQEASKFHYGTYKILTLLSKMDRQFVRVFSFDFAKAFDTVPHDILFEKLKKLPINPYVVNWVISFFKF